MFDVTVGFLEIRPLLKPAGPLNEAAIDKKLFLSSYPDGTRSVLSTPREILKSLHS
jgi:hypothetical protein